MLGIGYNIQLYSLLLSRSTSSPIFSAQLSGVSHLSLRTKLSAFCIRIVKIGIFLDLVNNENLREVIEKLCFSRSRLLLIVKFLDLQ